jgi:hypothetical protein
LLFAVAHSLVDQGAPLCALLQMLRQFIIRVPRISSVHHVCCITLLLLPSVSPNKKSFSMVTDIHERHGTIEWQGHSMAWQGNSMGIAWVWHGMCELALRGLCI